MYFTNVWGPAPAASALWRGYRGIGEGVRTLPPRPEVSYPSRVRWFNTAGPNDPSYHYTLPPLARLPEVAPLVASNAYFVVHAPRQSGKTTVMRAFARELTASGTHVGLYTTCEMGGPFSNDPETATCAVIDALLTYAQLDLPLEMRPDPTLAASCRGHSALFTFLSSWSSRLAALGKPLFLVLDEIDALQDNALLSVLRQLRAGYAQRPHGFPASVALVGLRDVRDYKMASGGSAHLGTASPLNVKVESLTLGSFSAHDVAALYGQHTAETGQPFMPAALDRAYELTRGQPWLANALAREVVFKMAIAPPTPITVQHVDAAKERLVLSRATHLDSLMDKLREDRVRRVIEPLLAGTQMAEDVSQADLEYCKDLGLVERRGRNLEIANPIYREVIPRELTAGAEDVMVLDHDGGRVWALPDGRLDLERLMAAFVDFWSRDGELLVRAQLYDEAACQLVLMAFLQRLINGGGHVNREYALGTGRLDLLVRWPIDGTLQSREWDEHALELKVWRDGRPDPATQALDQLDRYLARVRRDDGWLVVFDRRTERAVAGHMETLVTPAGRQVRLLRL